jgi:hypothetical protein
MASCKGKRWRIRLSVIHVAQHSSRDWRCEWDDLVCLCQIDASIDDTDLSN